jgi:hypothetical protein
MRTSPPPPPQKRPRLSKRRVEGLNLMLQQPPAVFASPKQLRRIREAEWWIGRVLAWHAGRKARAR